MFCKALAVELKGRLECVLVEPWIVASAMSKFSGSDGLLVISARKCAKATLSLIGEGLHHTYGPLTHRVQDYVIKIIMEQLTPECIRDTLYYKSRTVIHKAFAWLES